MTTQTDIHITIRTNITPSNSSTNTINIIRDSHQPTMNSEQLDILKLGKQLKFNLAIPSEDEQLPRKQFRLERTSFALACQTNTSSKIPFIIEMFNIFFL